MQQAALHSFVSDVTRFLQAERDIALAACAIEKSLKQVLTRSDCLPEEYKTCCPDGYKRHLLHVDPDLPFTFMSLVWRPGQASPVHGHSAWCVVGILEGELTIEAFDSCKDGLTCSKTVTAGPGATSIELPDKNDIHRIVNNGHARAVSLHLYGMDLTDDPGKINCILQT